MLTIDNVHKTFFAGTVNERRALAGVSLTLQEGDFLTVIGSNGAGKSTILNAISGSLIPDTGTVRVESELGKGVRFVLSFPAKTVMGLEK